MRYTIALYGDLDRDALRGRPSKKQSRSASIDDEMCMSEDEDEWERNPRTNLRLNLIGFLQLSVEQRGYL